jgi:hypothetical protein
VCISRLLPVILGSAAITLFLIAAAIAKTGAGSADKGLVTVEFKEGEKVTGRITKETRDDIYILYPNETFEAVIPRFKIEDIRKPTDEELAVPGEKSSEKSRRK